LYFYPLFVQRNTGKHSEKQGVKTPLLSLRFAGINPQVFKMGAVIAPFYQYGIAGLGAEWVHRIVHFPIWNPNNMADSNIIDGTTGSAGNPLSSIQERFKAMPQKNRVAILFGVPLLLGALISLFIWANQASYRVLFSGLNDKDGGEITAALEQMKVPYQFNGQGTAILVPSDKVYDTRLALASKGLPKGSVAGFEAMDNQKLGITQFQEQVNYQRALEGELVRSIQSLSAVHGARVHLAIPKPSIFIREKQTPTASVILNLHGGRTLSESQIQGIVHMVSSSLPGMMPDSVSIVDQTGRLLTNKNENTEGLNPTQLAYTGQIESNLTARIIDILTPMFGRENVKATVTADVDFARSERTDEIFKPNGDGAQSIRSQQVSETKDGSSANPSGVPGTLSNQPAAAATAPIGGDPQANLPAANTNAAAATESSSRKDSTINYEVDKSVQYTKEQVGKLKRLSAAVVVNFKSITDPKGNTKQVPLTQEEVAQIDELVKQAIGFTTERGDKVNVVNQQFASEEVAEVSMWSQPETLDMAKSIGLPLGIALAAAIVVFGLFRPMLKPVTLERLNEGPELLPGQNKVPLLANSVGGDNDIELLEQLEREGTVPGLTRDDKMEQLRRLAREHPQVVASIVKNWVNGEAQGA
jgi:flagellar M-ring protein FliF